MTDDFDHLDYDTLRRRFIKSEYDDGFDVDTAIDAMRPLQLTSMRLGHAFVRNYINALELDETITADACLDAAKARISETDKHRSNQDRIIPGETETDRRFRLRLAPHEWE